MLTLSVRVWNDVTSHILYNNSAAVADSLSNRNENDVELKIKINP